MHCWLLSWRRIEPLLLTNAGCRHCIFGCISLICWAYFSDILVSPGFRKLWWIRLAADYQAVTMTCFWCKFGFGKCFGVSLWSNHWAGCCQLLYKSHFSSHITIQLRNGCCCIEEKQHFKTTIFFICGSSWGTLVSSFFTFKICFKCQTTVE